MLNSESGKHDYEQTTTLIAQVHQDADIHPDDLSGDENDEESILGGTKQSPKANFWLSVTTIIKTVIGSGLLSIPYSMNKMGWVLGTFLFLLSGVMTQFAAVLMLKAKNLCHHSNYATIFNEVWNSRIAKGICNVMFILTAVGICAADLIIFKTSIRKIITDIIVDKNGDPSILDQFYTSEYFLVLIMALAEFPFTLVSKIQKLKFMAMIGVLGISVFMIVFVIYYITAINDSESSNQPIGGMKQFPQDWFSAAAAVPNLLLAITYQINLFPIFKGLKNATDKRISLASVFGIIFCIGSYLLIGILGYNYVGDGVNANFLVSLPYNKISLPFYLILNFTFLSSIFFAFSVIFFAGRNNFIGLIKLGLLAKEQYIQKNWRKANQQELISEYASDEIHDEKKRKQQFRFYAFTILIYLTIVGIAMAVDDLQIVFNIVGAICSNSMGIFLPCICYIVLIDRSKQQRNWKYYIAAVVFIVMAPYTIFSIVALYVNVN